MRTSTSTSLYDWPEAAAAVIARGCEVNATIKQGFTALHLAGHNNRPETARVLLEHGADRTIKTKYGDTAADLARSKGNDDLAAYIDGAPARPPRAARQRRRRRRRRATHSQLLTLRPPLR